MRDHRNGCRHCMNKRTSAKIDLKLVLLLLLGSVLGRVLVPVLDSQRSLLAQFEHAWNIAWPAAVVVPVPAVLHETVRGFGQCQSLVRALEMDEHETPLGASFVFEPDALPFHGVAYTWLDAHRFDVHQVYFLGGHNVRCTPQCTITFPWTNVNLVYGGYGIVLSAHGRRAILPRLSRYCASNITTYSSDVFLSVCFDAVIATPLLVDHPSQGYSNTWRANKTWPWAGKRAWWRIDERIDVANNTRTKICQ